MGKMREAGLVDRIIYGSDGPQSPGFVKDYLSRTVQAMRATGYTADEAIGRAGRQLRPRVQRSRP